MKLLNKVVWRHVKKAAAGAAACLAVLALPGAPALPAGIPAAVSGAGLEGLAADTFITAYGADSSVIESVSITFKTEFGEQEEIPEPEITAGGGGYYIVDYQYRTEYEKWKPGKKVRVEITLAPEDGKVFPTSLNRSKCKVTGADYVSAKALDDEKFQVRVDYKPVTVLGNTTQAGWSSTYENRAVWKAVDYAPGYSVTLYGDNKVVKRLNVETANVDLSQYMKDQDKTYYYEVKAVPLTSDEKKYLKEGEAVSSTEQEFDWEEMGSATADGGDIKGNNYILPDGTKERNTWKKISNQWYYFDGNGNMARGWAAIDGFWYYMDGNGVMQTGWVNPSGDSWYYLGNNGDMCTGWIQPRQGEWYYLDGSGLMRRYWVQLDGKWYFMDQSGRMLTGWITVEGKNYFLYSDGSMAADTTVSGRQLGADGAEIR